jgi:hypothetical protein
VLSLVHGFAVILGDDWALLHQLLVDYGVSSTGQAPSMLLCSKRMRFFPVSSPQAVSYYIDISPNYSLIIPKTAVLSIRGLGPGA